MVIRAAALVLIVIGCAHDDRPPTPCSVDDVTGTLPGVSISIRADSCSLARGEAATFVYEVTTTANVPAITVMGNSGPDCSTPDTNPLSWIEWRIGEGDQSYCRCDVGPCQGLPEETVQPAPTTESAMIEWSGNTWSGPSDTGNREGDPFLPGLYNVMVEFDGRDQGKVTANLPIEIY